MVNGTSEDPKTSNREPNWWSRKIARVNKGAPRNGGARGQNGGRWPRSRARQSKKKGGEGGKKEE